MEIKRAGSLPSGKGPGEWFTSTVRIDPLFAVQDPSSPRYQHFYTPEEWDAAYGPEPAAVAGVVSWLQAGGLEVLQADGSYVYAAGTASQVQSRFGVTMRIAVSRALRMEPFERELRKDDHMGAGGCGGIHRRKPSRDVV